ncbi:hypothetical protein Syun_006307 [Stephania yunnanensis]|uniref:Uncharacterized protein n=1 Tax=Stephania yunnanensis TaxID=152371 RepID=A0AAP0KWF7_9MAGN
MRSFTLSLNQSSLISSTLSPKPHHFDSFRTKTLTQTLVFIPTTTITTLSFNSSRRSIGVCASEASNSSSSSESSTSGGRSDAEATLSKGGFDDREEEVLTAQVASPSVPVRVSLSKLSLSDQAFFLLAFIACTTSVAFTSLVIAAVPTLYAMGRAATSLSKLADTAREELPSTMAAIRLSGMEISDLTLELSDLSQEIADGVNKSTQAVQAAEAGIRQIGTLARQQTISMIQERASLPIISLQPVVVGAAMKTSSAVGRATRSIINILSGGEFGSKNGNGSEKIEM